MSLVGQREFEQLSKLVEELLEWREEAEEELEELKSKNTELEKKNIELEARVEARMEEQKEAVEEILTTRVEGVEARLAEVERAGWNEDGLIRVELGGGVGGRGGETEYVAPDGTTVVSSIPTYTDGRKHWIEHLFSGTQRSTSDDSWLVRPGSSNTLTFLFPAPLPLAMIRVHTTNAYPSFGISSFVLTVSRVDTEDVPLEQHVETRASLERDVWVECVLPSGGLVSEFVLDFSTNVQYLAADSIELLIHPSALPTLHDRMNFLLKPNTVSVNTPCEWALSE